MYHRIKQQHPEQTHLAVLRNLDLLHKLTQGSTVPSTVLTTDANLLGTLSHFVLCRFRGVKGWIETDLLGVNDETETKPKQQHTKTNSQQKHDKKRHEHKRGQEKQ